jgi:hypothetical protein
MLKLIEFSNMKEFTYPSVESFQRRHNIYFTVAGHNRGYEDFCMTKHANTFFCFHKKDLNNEAESNLWLQPSERNETMMSNLLRKSQIEYRSFLDACNAGHLDMDFINSRIAQFSGKHLIAVKTDSPFRLSFELELRPDDIETHIDVYEIIYPLWRGEGEQFSRIMKCKNCRNYFCPRSLKAEFCSVKCKNAYNYRKTI